MKLKNEVNSLLAFIDFIYFPCEGGVSDRGYNSLTQEDVKRMSQMVMSTATDDNGSISSPTTSENSDKASKSRLDAWNPLNLSFLGLTSVHKSLQFEKFKRGEVIS